MSKSHSAIVLLVLTGTCVGCKSSNYKEDARIALRQEQVHQDSLRQSTLEATIAERYPDAIMWDSLNYEYTYAYQKRLLKQPVVILSDYQVIDIMQSDSAFHLFAYCDNITFNIDMKLNDSLSLKKIVPTVMKPSKYGRLTYEKLMFMINDSYMNSSNHPWIVIHIDRISNVSRIKNILENAENSDDGNTHYTYTGLADFSGTLLEVVE
jgi:hypothetical protein